MQLLLTLTLAVTTLSGPGDPWTQYASLEQAGFDPALVARARELAEESDSAAVLLIVDGRVVVAWGDVTRRFKCHSVRKSLLSALYGMHVESGAIDLDATLAELGIDDLEPLTDDEKQARVIDLLRARSGVYHPAAKEPRDMSESRPARASHAPGTHWWYNNWDFNTLLTIFEQTSETRVFEEFQRRLARPLGMQDFRLRDGYYQLEPSKSQHAAYAFRLSARDLARFGQLFLQHGEWNGEQLVPADWVAESTGPHSEYAHDGYGYMWWSHLAGSYDSVTGLEHLNEHDAFAARGTGGQFVLVVPDADFVFVHRGDTDNARHVSSGAILRMADLLLAARVAQPAADAELVALEATPFSNPGPAPADHDEVALAPELIARLVGTYELAPNFAITLNEYDARLFAISPEGEVELFCEGGLRFFAKGVNLAVEFDVDDSGRVTGMRGQLRGRAIDARRR